MKENLFTNRLGYHYYPDADHYRKEDLSRWLPRLEMLGASWITLIAHPFRAIPEFFIQALLDQNITPVVHIPCRADIILKHSEISTLFMCYAKWGVKYIALFDCPNNKTAWSTSAWSQSNLVDRFLDQYIPLAKTLLALGIKPVFPPLDPGGDFWDTAFLKKALAAIQRRGEQKLADQLILGVYAWTYGKPLSWGVGGPERWNNNRPYFTPTGNQDQLGFHSYEWLQAQALLILGRELPVLMLRAGCRISECDANSEPSHRLLWHAEQNRLLAEWISGVSNASALLGIQGPSNKILGCNFWLLASGDGNSARIEAWYPSNNRPLPVVEAFLQMRSEIEGLNTSIGIPSMKNDVDINLEKSNHYVLIPEGEPQYKNIFTEAAAEFIQCKTAKVGSSFNLALNAKRITILGFERWLTEAHFDLLRSNGCMIEEVYGSGTVIATKLTSL
jgi:hypothetical protein